MRLWYLSNRRPAKAQASLHIRAARQSLCCSHTCSMEVDEGTDQKPIWMAAHAHLKNEFTGDKKYHNVMT